MKLCISLLLFLTITGCASKPIHRPINSHWQDSVNESIYLCWKNAPEHFDECIYHLGAYI